MIMERGKRGGKSNLTTSIASKALKHTPKSGLKKVVKLGSNYIPDPVTRTIVKQALKNTSAADLKNVASTALDAFKDGKDVSNIIKNVTATPALKDNPILRSLGDNLPTIVPQKMEPPSNTTNPFTKIIAKADKRFSEAEERFTEADKQFTEADKRFTEAGKQLTERVKKGVRRLFKPKSSLDQGSIPVADQPTDPTPDQASVLTSDQPTDPTPDQPTDPTPDQASVPAQDQPTDPTPDQPTVPAPDQPTDPTPDQASVPAPMMDKPPQANHDSSITINTSPLDSWKSRQQIFKLGYATLSYLIAVIIVVVIVLALLNLLQQSLSYIKDLGKRGVNSVIQYRDLSTFKYLDYLFITYEDYSPSNEPSLIYLQQIILNSAIVLIMMFAILILSNLFIFFVYKFMMGAKSKDDVTDSTFFIDEEIKNNMIVVVFFCIVASVMYLAMFSILIYTPLNDTYSKMKEADAIVSQNLVNDEVLLQNCLRGDAKFYIEQHLENVTITPAYAEKILFTYYLIKQFQTKVPDVKNDEVQTKLLNYMRNPADDKTGLFGFTNVNDFSFYECEKSIVDDFFKDNLKESSKATVLLNVKNKIEELKKKLINCDAKFNVINPQAYSLITFFVLFICFLEIIQVYVLKTTDRFYLIKQFLLIVKESGEYIITKFTEFLNMLLNIFK